MSLRCSNCLKNIDESKNIWREHCIRMEKDSIPKAACYYAPQDSRNVGRTRKTMVNDNSALHICKLKFYKTMAVPVVLYGSESWITKERDKSNVQSAELGF